MNGFYCGADPTKRSRYIGGSALSLRFHVSAIITSRIFNRFLPRRSAAPASGFYTYAYFLAAARAYNGFGSTGGSDVRKRELAAFFANIAHETGSKSLSLCSTLLPV